MVQHIVLLKLKDGTTQNQTQAVLDGLTGLIGKLPGILSVIGGENISPEGKSAGFGWGFVMAFEDLASRDAYLPHPDHKAVSAKFIRPIVDDVLVFDYTAG
ncbi:MAG: Dabb family protein [Candidatus Latescibacterota bacterium]|nr:Dabb family protein [Candidatus Latescibacterota bacterium]